MTALMLDISASQLAGMGRVAKSTFSLRGYFHAKYSISDSALQEGGQQNPLFRFVVTAHHHSIS